MSTLSAAEQVLREAGKPLDYREISRLAIERGYWQSKGKTPWATENLPPCALLSLSVGGAILGRCGCQTLLRFSTAWGGLNKHKPLIDAALLSQKPITPLLPRSPDLTMFWPVFDHPGCSI